jgi:hypothetical protein
MDDALASYASDPIAFDILAELSVDPIALPRYSFVNALIRHKERVCLKMEIVPCLGPLGVFHATHYT